MRPYSCLCLVLVAAHTFPVAACAVDQASAPVSSPEFETTVPPAPDAPPIPPPTTSFLWGIQEGSARALGVLRVANRFSQEEFAALGLAPAVSAALLAQRPFRNLHALAAAEMPLDDNGIRSLDAAAAGNRWTEDAYYQTPIREFTNYQIIERADGSLSAFSLEGRNGYLQHDMGARDQRIVRIPDAQQKVNAETIWREARNTGQLFGLSVIDNGVGNQAVVVHKLVASTQSGQGVVAGELVTIAAFMIGKLENPSVAMTVDAEGAVDLVYPMTSQYGTAGIYLTHCSSAGSCARQLITADTQVPYTVLAAEQLGDEMVIARRVTNLPTLVETYTRRGGAPITHLRDY